MPSETKKRTVKNPLWLTTDKVQKTRVKKYAEWMDRSDAFQCRIRRIESAGNKARLCNSFMPCEKCNRPTVFEVNVMGRWARWDGCL